MDLGVLSRLRRSVLALPLAALAALVVFAINEGAYHQSMQSLDNLGERGIARVQLQTLLRRLIDAETGQRGYLLTGRKEYLQPYTEAQADVSTTLKWLGGYYGADPQAGVVLAQIKARAGEKLSEAETTIRLYDDGRDAAWREVMLTDIGREKMESIRLLADQLLTLEAERVAVDRSSVYSTLRISRIGVNAMTALSLLALFMFLRQTVAFDALQARLTAALQSERDVLEAEVVRRTADLTELAGHLQATREDERSRLARELHDELGALLTAAKLDAARLKRSLGAMSPDAQARLAHLNDTINNGIGLKRRIIEDLRPSSLSNLGLVAALEIQAREFAQRSELTVDTALEAVPLSDQGQITLYRLVQESLTNIAKYSGAKRVQITLAREGDKGHISVRDDGRGFDVRTVRGSAHGLMGMRYRVEAGGGVMRVDAGPGRGTVIEAWMPVHTDDKSVENTA